MHMLSSQCMQNLFVFLTITKSQEYYSIIHHNMLFVHEKLFSGEVSFLKNHTSKHMNGPRGYYGHFTLQIDIFINAFGILPSPE